MKALIHKHTHTHTYKHTHSQTDGRENASCCKINGSCDSQSNAWQTVSIANQTAGGMNVDALDVCQCHLGNRRGGDLQHTTKHALISRAEHVSLVCFQKDPEATDDGKQILNVSSRLLTSPGYLCLLF